MKLFGFFLNSIGPFGKLVFGVPEFFILFSKLLKWLLEHYHDTTMAVLVGLMIGSLRALWPWLNEADNALRLPAAGDPIAAVIGLAVLGFGVVAALTWWSVRQGFAE